MHKVAGGCVDGIARSFDRIQRKSIRPKVEYLRRPERDALGNRDVAQLVEYASGDVWSLVQVQSSRHQNRGRCLGFFHRATADYGLRFRKRLDQTGAPHGGAFGEPPDLTTMIFTVGLQECGQVRRFKRTKNWR